MYTKKFSYKKHQLHNNQQTPPRANPSNEPLPPAKFCEPKEHIQGYNKKEGEQTQVYENYVENNPYTHDDLSTYESECDLGQHSSIFGGDEEYNKNEDDDTECHECEHKSHDEDDFLEETTSTECSFTDEKCPICFDPLSGETSVCEYQDCGARHCKKCLDQWFAACMKEKKDDGGLGRVHPHGLKYADGDNASNTSGEDRNEIARYQNATPQTEPDWEWFHINGKDYFLEKQPGKQNKLWRYAREEAPDDEWNHSEFWRYITPPNCPVCLKPCITVFKEYAR